MLLSIFDILCVFNVLTILMNWIGYCRGMGNLVWNWMNQVEMCLGVVLIRIRLWRQRIEKCLDFLCTLVAQSLLKSLSRLGRCSTCEFAQFFFYVRLLLMNILLNDCQGLECSLES